MSKFIAIIIAIPLLVALYFFDNIKGYYRFKQICEKEGGLRVYKPLEKNVGWVADDYDAAHMAAQLKHVEFVRYTEKISGNMYDLSYLGGNVKSKNSYKNTLVDESKKIKYKWVNINYFLPKERNLFLFGYNIVGVDTNKILARYHMYEYLLYGGPLDSKSTASCFRDDEGPAENRPLWYKELNSVFKD